MAAGFGDHLWQSSLFCAAIWLCSLLTRPNAPAVRLRLLFIAAVKLVLPFSMLFALGEWIGFPVKHSADAAPAVLVAAIPAMAPIFTPAKYFALSGLGAAAYVSTMLFAAAVAAHWIRAQTRRELQLPAADESPPSIGFFKAALLTLGASCAILAPLIAGAVEDRQWRHQLLIANSLSLRTARAVLAPAAPGMGARPRVIASASGVQIRNASIRDLVAIVYGVNSYLVFTEQMFSSAANPAGQFWMTSPRYDIRVDSPIREPQEFDAYAVRQPVTVLLAEQFGLQIQVNKECQPPCGRYGMPLSNEAL